MKYRTEREPPNLQKSRLQEFRRMQSIFKFCFRIYRLFGRAFKAVLKKANRKSAGLTVVETEIPKYQLQYVL